MDFPPSVFGTAGLFYTLVIPVIFFQVIALAFIPSMLNSGARARAVGRAIYSYMMEGLGLILMTVSGIPALYSVLIGAPFLGNVYLGLLLMFAIGGFLFLWYESKVQYIDEPSRVVAHSLFFYTVKFIGILAVLLSLLSLVGSMLFTGATMMTDWWITPVIFLAYGCFLTLCTKTPRWHLSGFQSHPSKKPPMAPTHPMQMQQMKTMIKPVAVKPVVKFGGKNGKKK